MVTPSQVSDSENIGPNEFETVTRERESPTEQETNARGEGPRAQPILRTDILKRTSEEERERGGEREKRERARIREEVGGPKAQPCPLTFAKLFPPPRACAQGPAQAADPPGDPPGDPPPRGTGRAAQPKPPFPPARAGPGGGTHGAALRAFAAAATGGPDTPRSPGGPAQARLRQSHAGPFQEEAALPRDPSSPAAARRRGRAPSAARGICAMPAAARGQAPSAARGRRAASPAPSAARGICTAPAATRGRAPSAARSISAAEEEPPQRG